MDHLSNLGFGAMRLPLLEQEKQINFEQLKQMIDLFIEHGFLYFDTAYRYHDGESERALKSVLVDRYPRTRYRLADKIPIWLIEKNNDYLEYFEKQCMKCGVEYFDYYLLHNLGKQSYLMVQRTGGFEFLNAMKALGRVQQIGFSFHDDPEILNRILSDHPEVDFVQLQINYLDWLNPNVQSKECYDIARKHNKRIVAMEPIKGGILAQPVVDVQRILARERPDWSCASWALRFVSDLEGVFMVLSGMSSLDQMKDNIRTFESLERLNQTEHATLRKAADLLDSHRLVPCTSCRYCVEGCPQKIDIPTMLAAYNAHNQFKGRGNARMYYERLTYGHSKADDCIHCGQCERVCPQHLKIMDYLKRITEAFETK